MNALRVLVSMTKKKIHPKTKNAAYKKNKFKAQLVQNELNEPKWIEID